MALWIGSPVLRSQMTVVSRWLVMPIAATSRADSPAVRSTSPATSRCDSQISSGVVLDPAGLGKDLAELFLRHRLDVPVVVEQDRPRAGRPLVERENGSHLNLPAAQRVETKTVGVWGEPDGCSGTRSPFANAAAGWNLQPGPASRNDQS